MHESWLAVLEDELASPRMQELRSFLVAEVEAGRRFYPPADKVFEALRQTALDDVRVVVLGQDPYHGAGQAMGLCFSVPPGVKPPPSLQNIFRELETDLGLPPPASGDLTPWAERGVLLLNAVSPSRPASPRRTPARAGRSSRTGSSRELSARREGVVFLLWGKYAQQKGAIVDRERHHVLTAAHPSPYSVSGFFGCRHFSQANALLEQQGLPPIDWTAVDEPRCGRRVRQVRSTAGRPASASTASTASSEARHPSGNRPSSTRRRRSSPRVGRDDYHLTEDLVDQAISWLRQQRASAPDRPFFLYFSPGATHAPHHVWPKWIEKFKGRFDQGWDRLREEIHVRQLELGVIPAGTQLTPRPEQLPAWDDYDDRYKPVASRLMEVLRRLPRAHRCRGGPARRRDRGSRAPGMTPSSST